MSSSIPVDKDKAVKATKPVKTQFIELIKSIQFAWFIGHSVTILSGIVYFLSYRFFRTTWVNFLSYRIFYLSVLESFGIILYQTESKLNVAKSIHDDNFQYFVILALLFISPILYSLSTLPFLIFAVFHSLNYFKSSILPILLETFTSKKSLLLKSGTSIDWFVRNYNEKLIKLSSFIEIFNFIIILIKSLFFWKNWLILIIYVLFIKLRYMNSIYIRGFFSKLEVQIDGLVSHPSVPVQVKKVWLILKSKIKFIGKYDFFKRDAAAGTPSTTTSTGETSEKKTL